MSTPETPQTTTRPTSLTPADKVKHTANVEITIQFRPVELFIDKQDFYKTKGDPIKLEDYPKYIENDWILYKINIRTDDPEPTFELTSNKVFIGDKGYAKVEYYWIEKDKEKDKEIEWKVKEFISQYFNITQTI